MANPKVSIIIINYNTPEITLNCIKSLFKNTKKVNFEIILIDNGSKKFLNTSNLNHKNIKFIMNSKNFGFAKANNQGINVARGEYILLLNSDTLINNNVIFEMTKWMDAHPRVGVASCMLVNPDGTIQGTGGYFPNLIRVFSWMTIEDIPGVDKIIKPFHPLHSKSVFKNEKFYEKKREIDWLTGAFLFIRKKVIDQVGLIDEDYFMYTEDVDFCYRAKKAGWKIIYLSKWSIVHLGGQSSTSEFPIVSEFKGIKLFYKKHYPSWQYPVARFFLKIGALLRMPINWRTYAKAFKIA